MQESEVNQIKIENRFDIEWQYVGFAIWFDEQLEGFVRREGDFE
jgi:hypothetical protein